MTPEGEIAPAAQRLSGMVSAGRTGDRLPPERRLAGQLGVGRAIVRRALLRLDAAELVHTRANVGTFIR